MSESLDQMKDTALAVLSVYQQSLAEWIVERWDDEVKHRPMQNIHRRTLDATWRKVYRHVTGGG
jgi:sulfatase maturation enzyme AslB (radical SAM superfamily)